MIKLTEIYSSPKEYDPVLEKVSATFSLREIFLNPKFIVFMKENTDLCDKASRTTLIEGMNNKARFTEISVATSGDYLQRFNIVGHIDNIAMALHEVRDR